MEKKINMEYNIPYYIFEEIVEYIEQTAQGKCKKATWENIKSLLNLAVINERLTREQANNLIETYCREK
ncbi:hypothetical protein [Thomasclavelia cocleata]|jgi:hypothetical protein|uniref:hypothetical protein n=1 Tax=Thomasclavelia cocleata TaxID=69824 RepID=UPI00272E854F|nr:hypothetical protein [Thomasclavelia cocleata]